MSRVQSGWRISWAIGWIAMSLLAFELVATRLFSVIVWNHFAFLAISVALFGFGVAGVAVYLLPKRFTAERAGSQIRACALLLGPVLWATVAILCSLPIRMDFTTSMFTYLTVLFAVSSIPFAVGGLAITLALTHWTQDVNRIYAFDLVGSAAGCGLVIVLLGAMDGPSAALALGVLPAVGALALGRPGLAATAAAVCALVTVANMTDPLVRIRVARSRAQQPLYEKWNAFSRVTVLPVEGWRGWWIAPDTPLPQVPLLGIQIDADAFTPMLQLRGEPNTLRHVLRDVSSAVHNLRPNAERSLVIGAGGGRDVIAALASGARHVRAVELNPLIARDVVSERFREFSGDLYRHPRVELVVGEGRTVLRHDEGRYDVVQLSMVDTSAASAAGAFALTENSLYTVEAVREYLQHLRPGGAVSTTWPNFPNLKGGLRLVSLFAEALRREGRTPVSERIAVIASGTPPPGAVPFFTVIAVPDGFTSPEVRQLRALCDRLRFRAIHLPGEPVSPGLEPYEPQVVKRIVEQGDGLGAFYDRYPLDLRPVFDDRPFFFYQQRLRDAWTALVTWNVGSLYGNGLFIMMKLLVVSGIAVVVFLTLPFVFRARGGLRGARAGRCAFYFLCLGAGFITVEISLVQTFGYYLGHPLLGLGVSLAAILLATGVGSGLGGRWPSDTLGPRLRATLGVLVGLGFVYAIALGPVTTATLGWSTALRCSVAVALLAPLGVLLGLPFPTGLRLMRLDPEGAARVPWMWSINAGATVLGSTLATLAVMHFGFATALVAGTCVYALALAAVPRGGPAIRRSAA